mgnify:CR=1 FL=1
MTKHPGRRTYCKLQVGLTREEHTELQKRAGLVPLATYVRALLKLAVNIPVGENEL